MVTQMTIISELAIPIPASSVTVILVSGWSSLSMQFHHPLGRLAGQLGIGFNTKFRLHSLPIGLNGVSTQVQTIGNFCDGQPLTNMLKDLKFSVG